MTIEAVTARRGRAMAMSACGLLILFAMAMLCLSRGAAAEDSKNAPFLGYTKYLRYHTSFQVNSDGTDVETHDWALKILTEQGVQGANQGGK